MFVVLPNSEKESKGNIKNFFREYVPNLSHFRQKTQFCYSLFQTCSREVYIIYILHVKYILYITQIY